MRNITGIYIRVALPGGGWQLYDIADHGLPYVALREWIDTLDIEALRQVVTKLVEWRTTDYLAEIGDFDAFDDA